MRSRYDDNEPAPENVPVPGIVEVDNAGSWGWDGTCNQNISGAVNQHPLISTLRGLILETASYVTVFLLFFPRKFIEEVTIHQTNLQLEDDMTIPPLSWHMASDNKIVPRQHGMK